MKAKKGFNLREVCKSNIIVAEGEENIDFSNIISMNDSSAYLWGKVQKMPSFTVEDMASLFMEEYEVDLETAMKDCQELAGKWREIGIIDD